MATLQLWLFNSCAFLLLLPGLYYVQEAPVRRMTASATENACTGVTLRCGRLHGFRDGSPGSADSIKALVDMSLGQIGFCQQPDRHDDQDRQRGT